MRKKLIETIVELSSDELDTSDYLQMAIDTDEQLLDRLINIASFYQTAYNMSDN